MLRLLEALKMTDDIVMWYRLGLHIKNRVFLFCLLLILGKNLRSSSAPYYVEDRNV